MIEFFEISKISFFSKLITLGLIRARYLNSLVISKEVIISLLILNIILFSNE